MHAAHTRIIASLILTSLALGCEVGTQPPGLSWPEGAAIEMKLPTDTGMLISWPAPVTTGDDTTAETADAADTPEAVISYELEIDGVLYETFEADVHKTELEALTPETSYLLKVTATDTTGRRSEPLTLSVTTLVPLRSCLGLSVGEAITCIEDIFWPAFQDEFDQRTQVFDSMEAVIAEHGDAVARVKFLRALLGVAIQTEELAMDPSAIELTRFIANMRGDLHDACDTVPDNAFYKSWRLSADLITALFLSDPSAVNELFDESVAHADEDFERNVLAIASTWMLFPNNTILPAEGLKILEQWVLGGYAYDIENSPKVPYSKAGAFLMIGDLYARGGKRDMALMHFEQSLVIEGSKDWPYRFLAEYAIDNIDEIMARFASIPDDVMPAGDMISFGQHSCKMCHSNVGP